MNIHTDYVCAMFCIIYIKFRYAIGGVYDITVYVLRSSESNYGG